MHEVRNAIKKKRKAEAETAARAKVYPTTKSLARLKKKTKGNKGERKGSQKESKRKREWGKGMREKKS